MLDPPSSSTPNVPAIDVTVSCGYSAQDVSTGVYCSQVAFREINASWTLLRVKDYVTWRWWKLLTWLCQQDYGSTLWTLKKSIDRNRNCSHVTRVAVTVSFFHCLCGKWSSVNMCLYLKTFDGNLSYDPPTSWQGQSKMLTVPPIYAPLRIYVAQIPIWIFRYAFVSYPPTYQRSIDVSKLIYTFMSYP